MVVAAIQPLRRKAAVLILAATARRAVLAVRADRQHQVSAARDTAAVRAALAALSQAATKRAVVAVAVGVLRGRMATAAAAAGGLPPPP
jgi:hypothetical protein